MPASAEEVMSGSEEEDAGPPPMMREDDEVVLWVGEEGIVGAKKDRVGARLAPRLASRGHVGVGVLEVLPRYYSARQQLCGRLPLLCVHSYLCSSLQTDGEVL